MKIPYDEPTAVGIRFIDLEPELTAAILRTIAEGWLIAKQHADVHAGAHEVPVTERLRDAMRAALAANNLHWARQLVVLPGTESRSDPNVLVPDGRTDIPLFFTTVFAKLQEHDPHAIIECKRLVCGNNELAKRYVLNGVDRFRTGQYAARHARGFMAGYVANGDAKQASGDVNKFLAKLGRVPESLRIWDTETAVWVRQSTHDRKSGAPIELIHAFLLLESG